jgi:hypothetical protein
LPRIARVPPQMYSAVNYCAVCEKEVAKVHRVKLRMPMS